MRKSVSCSVCVFFLIFPDEWELNLIKQRTNTSFHTVVDPEGLNLLTAANGPGALRTQKHDIIQGTLVEEAARAGVQAWTNQVINTETAIRVSN